MKIISVTPNNRKRAFEVRTRSRAYPMPYAKLRVRPSSSDRVVEAFPDPEVGEEGFTYRLESGEEDTIHLDAVLEYNQTPSS